MKDFEAPMIEVTAFAVEDVITTSSWFTPPEQGENQTPYG